MKAKEGDTIELKDGHVLDVVEVYEGTQTYYAEVPIRFETYDPSVRHLAYTIDEKDVSRILV